MGSPASARLFLSQLLGASTSIHLPGRELDVQFGDLIEEGGQLLVKLQELEERRSVTGGAQGKDGARKPRRGSGADLPLSRCCGGRRPGRNNQRFSTLSAAGPAQPRGEPDHSLLVQSVPSRSACGVAKKKQPPPPPTPSLQTPPSPPTDHNPYQGEEGRHA
ncbi:hypothetical protein chiPu_0023370 [Chiloscyllium punctatum]|uniref:Uncharacterized protein n=1 Tax=Chiloscyllium punctatum TaxID=137246 RepID=A0A401T9C3_CHIPU|nr:hypothetical protein [Chiloscyllium punctatum]